MHLPTSCRDQLGAIMNVTAQRLDAIWDEVTPYPSLPFSLLPPGLLTPAPLPSCPAPAPVPPPQKVGFSEAERLVQVNALLKELERLCDEKVTDEEAVRDTFVASIAENKEKVLDCARRLNEAPPDLECDEEGTPVRLPLPSVCGPHPPPTHYLKPLPLGLSLVRLDPIRPLPLPLPALSSPLWRSCLPAGR